MGDNVIHHTGHVRMMAAVQPFISGAISKTVNMPEEATVEEVEQLHIDAWRLGVKAIAIYRDNCKVGQPLSTAKKEGGPPPSRARTSTGSRQGGREDHQGPGAGEAAPQPHVEDLRVPGGRLQGLRHHRRVRRWAPGELFLRVSKQGSTLAGIMDAFSISVSYGLQYGVPLRHYIEAFTNTRFEPAGITDDADLRIATSILDYIFRRLAVNYLSYEERAELGILTTGERTQPTLPGVEETVVQTSQGQEVPADPPSIDSSSPTLFDNQRPAEPSLLERAGVTDAEKPTRRQSPAITPPGSVDAVLHAVRGADAAGGSCHACLLGSTSGCESEGAGGRPRRRPLRSPGSSERPTHAPGAARPRWEQGEGTCDPGYVGHRDLSGSLPRRRPLGLAGGERDRGGRAVEEGRGERGRTRTRRGGHCRLDDRGERR